MRRYLRFMAKEKMKKMGMTKVNKRINGNWRRIMNAYPVHVITRKKMKSDYKGAPFHKAGSTNHLFCYHVKAVEE